MKAAIEKAIEKGFDLKSFLFNKEAKGNVGLINCKISADEIEIYCYYGFWEGNISREKNIYQLLFGTDFIDKLVGEGRLMCGEENRPCDGDCYTVKVWKTPKGNCSMRKTGLADYHRSHLANLKDIEAIKDYVEGLV